eukprot:Opistho-2@69109
MPPKQNVPDQPASRGSRASGKARGDYVPPRPADVIFVTSHLLDPTQAWIVLTEDICGIRAKEFLDAINFVPNLSEYAHRVPIGDLRLSDGVSPLTKDMLTTQKHKEKSHLSHVWVGNAVILVMGSLYRRKFNENLLHTPFFQSCVLEMNKVSFTDVWTGQASLDMDGVDAGGSGSMLGGGLHGIGSRGGDISMGSFSHDLALAHSAGLSGIPVGVSAAGSAQHGGQLDGSSMDGGSAGIHLGHAHAPSQSQGQGLGLGLSLGDSRATVQHQTAMVGLRQQQQQQQQHQQHQQHLLLMQQQQRAHANRPLDGGREASGALDASEHLSSAAAASQILQLTRSG